MIKAKIFSCEENEGEKLSLQELRAQALDKVNSDLTLGRIINIIEKAGRKEVKDSLGYDLYPLWINLIVYYEDRLETPIKIIHKE